MQLNQLSANIALADGYFKGKGNDKMNTIDFLSFLSSTSSSISVGQVVFNLLITLGIAMFIFWVYKRTYSGVMYSKSFNVTIILTSLVTAMVMMVIGSNLALSLGMVGALSIIRFRSAIKDPKDIGFLFWGITSGLASGTGSYTIAIAGSLVIAIILFIVDNYGEDEFSYLLIIRGMDIDESNLLEAIKKSTSKYKLKMKNHNELGQEIIYEVRIEGGNEEGLVKSIKSMGENLVVNIISHNGEITG